MTYAVQRINRNALIFVLHSLSKSLLRALKQTDFLWPRVTLKPSSSFPLTNIIISTNKKMPLVPFDISYLIFTPKRVRLPGEPPQSPRKKTSSRYHVKWSAGIANRARSLRSLASHRLSISSPVPRAQITSQIDSEMTVA